MAVKFLDEVTIDGNVGIGTTSPDSRLELIGDYKQKAADGNSQGFTLSINPSTDAVSLNNYYNASMTFSTNNSAKMTILGSGNVGIGNTSPSAKLQVNGTSGTTQAIIGSGTQNLYVGVNGTNVDLKSSGNSVGTFSFSTGNTERIRINSAGSVGIGTIAPAEKLAVAGNIRVTGVGNALNLDTLGVAGSNGIKTINNFETVVFNGRGSAGFAVIGNANIRLGFGGASTTSNADLLINSSGNVGIGTVSPVAKLHVSSGVLRVEGAGCGIQMPDTSGNPTLKIVTDQNNFTGCNIINGWGNSLNTGVGIGTTRSDGIAMQVRTGVGLSSGFATNSGTSRFQVNGNGNVGIGTTSPGERLEVSGSVKATGYKTSSGSGVTTNVTVRNQNNSGTKTFQIVGGIIVGVT